MNGTATILRTAAQIIEAQPHLAKHSMRDLHGCVCTAYAISVASSQVDLLSLEAAAYLVAREAVAARAGRFCSIAGYNDRDETTQADAVALLLEAAALAERSEFTA
jgi:hypothetical protein